MARERRHRSRPRRRRGRFSGLYKLISVLLIAAAVVAACVVFFHVNVITVEGNSRYTAQEIIDASGIQAGDNLIALSKSRIAARIRVGLPYVYSVSIERKPPDTVVLKIEEHVAAAAVRDTSGSWWYISSSGKVLEQGSGSRGVMPIKELTAQNPIPGDRLQVPEGQENRLERVLSLLHELDTRGLLEDCTQLDCSGAGVFVLDYLDFEIKMPAAGDYAYILDFLDAAFEDGRVSRSDSGSFDFTVAEKKAIYNGRKSS